MDVTTVGVDDIDCDTWPLNITVQIARQLNGPQIDHHVSTCLVRLACVATTVGLAVSPGGADQLRDRILTAMTED